MPTALITGVTGQDGAYLAQFLVEKGYDVFGMARRTSAGGFHDERLRWLGVLNRIRIVEGDLHELFGWVVREGLTNVVRHSRATACRVQISPNSVEIVDDGTGGANRRGNGLNGLAERVAGAGGVIEAGPVQPRGWRLAVRLVGASSL